MPRFKSLLEETLEAWTDVRQGLIDEVENIPDASFGFRPTSEARSVTGKASLLELLRSSMDEVEREFRDVGELAMLQLITRFDGERGTKLAWLQHGIAQEMYHRGQLTLYERLMDMEPALTRRIREGS